MSKRINHVDHPTVSIPARGRMIPADPASGVMEKFDAGLICDLTNPRAVQCEVEWDGTINARLQTTLTGQDIGTGDVSLVWKGRLNTAAAEQWLIATGPATGELMGGAGGFGIYKTAAGHLQAGIQATAGYEFRRVASAVTLFGDREVIIIATRAGSTLKIFIDGVDTAHTAGDTSTPMIAAAITTTYLAINFRGTNYSAGYRGSFSRGWIANCALSQSDVLAIQRLGGRVPDWLKWGTQVASYTSNYSAGADGWGADAPVNNTGNIDGINGQDDWLAVERTSSTGIVYSRRDIGAATSGKALRLRARVFIPAGSPITHIHFFANNAATVSPARAVAANTQYDLDELVVTSRSVSNLCGVRACDASGAALAVAAGTIFYQKALIATFAGAVVFLDADNGGYGFTLPDESSLGLHATFPVTTGWSWSRNTKLVDQGTDGYADNTAGPVAIAIPSNTFGDLLLAASQGGIGESYWRVPYVKIGATLALGTAAKAIRSGDPISSVSVSSNNVSVALVAANTFLKFKLVDVRWF